MNRRALLIGAPWLLSGCITAPDVPLTVSDAPFAGCCASLREARAIEYGGAGTLRVELTAKSPEFRFSTGSSRFLLIHVTGRYRFVEITTAQVGLAIPFATVFVPSLAFLDDAYKVLSSIEPELYQNTGKMGDPRTWAYFGAQALPADARYVVVFNDASKGPEATVALYHTTGYAGDVYTQSFQDRHRDVPTEFYASGIVEYFQLGFESALKRQPLGEVRVAFS